MSDSSSSPVEVPPEALVHVGYVFRPHGVRGEMKVDPEATDNPHRFETFSTVYIGHDPSHVRRCDVESVRFQETKRGTTVILRLGGVDDRNEAERLAKRKDRKSVV